MTRKIFQALPLAAMVLLLAFTGDVSAEDAAAVAPAGPAADQARAEGQALHLSVREALVMAIGRNLQLRDARIAVQISSLRETIARSEFDPVLKVAASGAKLDHEGFSELDGAEVLREGTVDGSLGLSKKLTSGATVTSELKNERFTSNSVFVDSDQLYTTNLQFSATQPLLRGRGFKANKATVAAARIGHQVSELALTKAVTEIIASTEKLYWDLVFADGNLKLNQLALERTMRSRRNIRGRVAQGLEAENRLLEVEAELAAMQESGIAAEHLHQSTEDRLKSVLSLSADPRQAAARVIATERLPAEGAPPDLESAFRIASANRADYRSAKLEVESRGIGVALARNGRLPQLDLVASFGLNGLQEGWSNSVDSATSTEFYDWQVGIMLELPLGRRHSKSTLRIRELEKVQALLRLKDLENRVLFEVREAARQVETARKRVQAAEATLRAREARLKAERGLLKIGRSTSHEVLGSELAVEKARSNHLLQVLASRKAKIDLEIAQGTLLASRGVQIKGDSVVIHSQ